MSSLQESRNFNQEEFKSTSCKGNDHQIIFHNNQVKEKAMQKSRIQTRDYQTTS